jgi:hypothetical protein
VPHIVQGKRFHRLNLPGPKLAPEHHHQVLTPITVSVEGAIEGSAMHKAEYELARAAGDVEEIVCTECVFSPAESGVACTLTGVPIKYLTPA